VDTTIKDVTNRQNELDACKASEVPSDSTPSVTQAPPDASSTSGLNILRNVI
jgi:hypothetical protein